MAPRFAFLVHPLVPVARRLIGLRTAQPRLFSGASVGTDPGEVAVVARVGFGDIDGLIVAVPMLPDQLLADQERALDMMERAVQIAAPVQFIGLGSVLSVVAGRGAPLQERCGIPITTGNAATAWAAAAVAREVAQGRPIAIHGGRTTVGKVLGKLLGATLDPQDFRDFPVVVGAHTTGGTLEPRLLAPGTTLVDVALPRSLSGPAPAGVRVIAGESVALPPGWRRDGWGWIFHLVAGYGLDSVYACLLEPLLALRTGRTTPFAQGRSLSVDAVLELGAAAEAAGFRPRVVDL